MDTKERTLDLTVFNRRNFAGRMRVRYIFDWANDYWEKGLELTKIKLNRDEYEDLKHQFDDDNIYVSRHKLSDLLTIDAGFGPIEIQVGEKF